MLIVLVVTVVCFLTGVLEGYIGYRLGQHDR